MKISVLGCGRWGSFIAWYLATTGHNVTLWGREESQKAALLFEARSNKYLTLPNNVKTTFSLDKALDGPEVVVISVGAQSFRSLAAKISGMPHPKNYLLCMKGIEEKSGKRLSEVFADEMGEGIRTAVWLGPGHAEDFVRGIPNCMVIDSLDEDYKVYLADNLSSELIRFYYGSDLIGNEIGAAAKNVYGIAAGMLDGFKLSSLKGALMARGAREVSRLIGRLGGNPISAYGLCHLGDYEATIFSPHSHNRRYGEAFILKEEYTDLAEGVYTCRAMMDLARKCGEELPICAAVYSMLFENADATKTLNALFCRKSKAEFNNV